MYSVFASFVPIASYSACVSVAIHVTFAVPAHVSQVFVT